MAENRVKFLIILAFPALIFILNGCKTKGRHLMENQSDIISNNNAEKAVFAAGCFWHVEHAFADVAGVISTTSGYTGGDVENPTYKMVCTDKTGHAEAVEIIYDPAQVTYEQLLDVFWKIHDPTQMNRQGPDVGTQYRSAIFYFNDEQKQLAGQSKKKLEESGRYSRPIETQIMPVNKFYKAEEYHQNYYEKHGFTCSPF